jgi:hypothetical protein
MPNFTFVTFNYLWQTSYTYSSRTMGDATIFQKKTGGTICRSSFPSIQILQFSSLLILLVPQRTSWSSNKIIYNELRILEMKRATISSLVVAFLHVSHDSDAALARINKTDVNLPPCIVLLRSQTGIITAQRQTKLTSTCTPRVALSRRRH